MDHLPVRLPRVVAGSAQMWLARAAPVGRGSGTTDRLLRGERACWRPAGTTPLHGVRGGLTRHGHPLPSTRRPAVVW